MVKYQVFLNSGTPQQLVYLANQFSMVKYQVFCNSGTPQQLVYLGNRFCSGIHPGTDRKGALYGNTKRGDPGRCL
jgi:cell division protein ZapA (FtsZ GTPase activity inhibitor)